LRLQAAEISRSRRCAFAHVIERFEVEESFSLRAQITEWFQDMHLVGGLRASSPLRFASSDRRAAARRQPGAPEFDGARHLGAREPGFERQPLPAQLRNEGAACVAMPPLKCREDAEYALVGGGVA
jgi:hypothetical protein